MTATGTSIQSAIRALAARCDGAIAQDGQGFNGRDSGFGRSLAQIPHDDWSEKQLSAAYSMLRTYQSQLAGLGIQYSEIRGPAAERAAQVEAWKARRAHAAVTSAATPAREPYKLARDPKNAARFLASFPYDGELIAKFKAAGMKAFKSDDGTWTWPIYADKIAGLLPLLEPRGFQGLDAVKDREAEKTLLAQASKAASVDFAVEISGLAPGMALRPFQEAGVAYARRTKKTFLGDEMGLGKSVQALATVEAEKAYPAAFVVPANLKLNWLAEAKKWFPARVFEVLDGHKAVPSGKADAYIASYSTIKADVTKDGNRNVYTPKGLAGKLSALKLKALVLDESHYCKDPKSQQSRGVFALAQGVPVVLELTGTPIKNRPIELAHQLAIMGRLSEFGGFMGFARKFCDAKQGRFGWDMKGSANLEELNQRLRETCYVRRLKVDVLKELPPLQTQVVKLPISNAAEYKRAEKDFIRWLRETKGDEKARAARRAETLVRIGALRKLAAIGKLEAVQAWVDDGFVQQDQKLVLFAHHIEAQDAYKAAFQAPSIRGEGQSKESIEADKKLFCDGDAPVIVCSLIAGGLGHNLHADGKCSAVAMAELGWTPADMSQAAARVHRMGQTAEAVNAYWLVGEGTIDEWMADLLADKQRVVDAATEGGKIAASAESIVDELVDMFSK